MSQGYGCSAAGCKNNYRVGDASACVACEAGSVRASGDQIAGGETFCAYRKTARAETALDRAIGTQRKGNRDADKTTKGGRVAARDAVWAALGALVSTTDDRKTVAAYLASEFKRKRLALDASMYESTFALGGRTAASIHQKRLRVLDTSVSSTIGGMVCEEDATIDCTTDAECTGGTGDCVHGGASFYVGGDATDAFALTYHAHAYTAVSDGSTLALTHGTQTLVVNASTPGVCFPPLVGWGGVSDCFTLLGLGSGIAEGGECYDNGGVCTVGGAACTVGTCVTGTCDTTGGNDGCTECTECSEVSNEMICVGRPQGTFCVGGLCDGAGVCTPPPTTAPTTSPSASPTIAPTDSPTVVPDCAAFVSGACGRHPVTGLLTPSCAVAFAAGNQCAAECALAPTPAPTVAPTAAPSTSPTVAPTA